MKKKSTSQLRNKFASTRKHSVSAPARRSLGEGGFFNLRVLFGLFVMLAGVFLALVSFGTFSSVFAQPNKTQPNRQAVQSAMAGFSKETNTTREEMAPALLQSVAGPDYSPPACVAGAEMFNDVLASNPFCPFIEELSRRGITGGCGGGNYCPSASVTRQQMAVFLVRAQFPSVVPSGLTLRGEWSFDAEGNGTGDWGAPISYPVPMPQVLTLQFRTSGSPATPQCPGIDWTSPEAAPGFVCVYHRESHGVHGNSIGGASNNTRFGVNVFFVSSAAGNNSANGTWAATAP